MLKKIKNLCLFLSLVITISPLAQAKVDSSDPYNMMSQVAEKAFNRFKAEQPQIKKNPDHLKVIVEEELMPYVDYQYAALKILGPNLKGAKKADVKSFIENFRGYLITSAAQGLTEYTNQTIRLQPEKKVKAQSRITTISLDILEQGRDPLTVDFKLIKNKKTGQWKVYDIIGEGISLLASKKSEWEGKIRQEGIASVGQQMALQAKKPIQLGGKK